MENKKEREESHALDSKEINVWTDSEDSTGDIIEVRIENVLDMICDSSISIEETLMNISKYVDNKKEGDFNQKLGDEENNHIGNKKEHEEPRGLDCKTFCVPTDSQTQNDNFEEPIENRPVEKVPKYRTKTEEEDAENAKRRRQKDVLKNDEKVFTSDDDEPTTSTSSLMETDTKTTLVQNKSSPSTEEFGKEPSSKMSCDSLKVQDVAATTASNRSEALDEEAQIGQLEEDLVAVKLTKRKWNDFQNLSRREKRQKLMDQKEKLEQLQKILDEKRSKEEFIMQSLIDLSMLLTSQKKS